MLWEFLSAYPAALALTIALVGIGAGIIARLFLLHAVGRLVRPLPGETTLVPGHPFEASAVRSRFLVFQVFPSEGRSSQSVNFHLNSKLARTFRALQSRCRA